MKSGANFKDRNDIVRLAEKGHDADEISGMLKIEREVVENFMPKESEPPAKKGK